MITIGTPTKMLALQIVIVGVLVIAVSHFTYSNSCANVLIIVVVGILIITAYDFIYICSNSWC